MSNNKHTVICTESDFSDSEHSSAGNDDEIKRFSSSEDFEEDKEKPEDEKGQFFWALRNDMKLFKVLLEKNKNLVYERDSQNYTALHYASSEDNIEAIKLLILAGSDVNAKTNDGWTTLHCACRWNNLLASKLLIDNGADVNIKSNGGVTCLQNATNCKENEKLLTLILSRRCIDVECQNASGDKAKDYALRNYLTAPLLEMQAEYLRIF